MTYRNLLKKLYSLNMKPNQSIKMGLDNSLALYKLLNNPVDDIPIVHIGGTNGKGSIALKISECLRSSGLKTGLFVSPHISSFRERAQINGTHMSEDDIITMLPRIFELCELHCIPASFFEISTILALLKFKQQKCDAIVLEVGLGGKLDATNIINSSVLSIITSVQLDHCKILGYTINDIAKVKAGIMKPNINVLVGPNCPIELLKEEAILTSSPFYTIKDLLMPNELKYDSNSFDADVNDIDNLSIDIARAGLKLLKSKGGIFSNINLMDDKLNIRPPCRFEVFHASHSSNSSNNKGNSSSNIDDSLTIPVILDIAHNVEACKSFVNKIKLKYPNNNIRIVLGLCADKDVSEFVKVLLQLVSCKENIYCVQAKHPRAIKSNNLRNIVDNSWNGLHKIEINNTNKINNNDINSNIKDHIRLSLRDAIYNSTIEFYNNNNNSNNNSNNSNNNSNNNNNKSKPIVLVTGSAFIMGDIRAELGILEPIDGDILLEAYNNK